MRVVINFQKKHSDQYFSIFLIVYSKLQIAKLR